MENNQLKTGILLTASSYLLWGFLPAFWKLIDSVPASVTLANRIVWSFVCMIALVMILKKQRSFLTDCKRIVADKKTLAGITLASLVITLNWLLFIWAVNSDHVLQASLGYYINPLISIVLAMIFLKEKLNRWQVLSFLLAASGVLYLTLNYGVFPWVSILLAVSFGLYGLLKKTVSISPIFGLTIETLIVMPFALIFLLYQPTMSGGTAEIISWTSLLLIAAGAVTALPLLLFAGGTQRIPLTMVGFLQYIAPTIMLLLGLFVYEEVFTSAHFVAFVLIWTALFLYTVSKMKWFRQLEEKLAYKRKSFNH